MMYDTASQQIKLLVKVARQRHYDGYGGDDIIIDNCIICKQWQSLPSQSQGYGTSLGRDVVAHNQNGCLETLLSEYFRDLTLKPVHFGQVSGKDNPFRRCCIKVSQVRIGLRNNGFKP